MIIKIESDFKKVIKIKGPVLIEVMTDNNQKIFDAFRIIKRCNLIYYSFIQIHQKKSTKT